MTRDEAMKAFRKAFERLAHTKQYHTVFNDFLDFALWMLNINKDQAHYNEIKHLDINYPKEDVPFMYELFNAWSYAADNDGEGFHDPLGDLFMELVSHGHNGQFFTPEPICDLMADITLGTEFKPGQTVMDCACGSGRILLAAGKRERKAKFYGADISETCCKMAVLNLLVNTMEGEIAHMDSLSLEHWKSWHIHKTLDLSGRWVPYYTTTGAGDSAMIGSIKKIHVDHEQKQQQETSYISNDQAIFNKPEQLSLF